MEDIEILTFTTNNLYINYFARLDRIISNQKLSDILYENRFRQNIEDLKLDFRFQLFNSFENFKDEHDFPSQEFLDKKFDDIKDKFATDCQTRLIETFDYFQKNGKEIYSN